MAKLGTKSIRAIHVRWRESDRAQLVGAVAKVLAVRPMANVLAALRTSQELLPPDKRRLIKGLSSVPWFEAMLEKKLKDDAARTAVASTPAALNGAAVGHIDKVGEPAKHALFVSADAPLPENTLQPEDDACIIALADGLDNPPALANALAGPLATLRTVLINELSQIIAQACLKALSTVVARSVEPQPATLAKPTEAPAKHTVLIAGLRGLQKEEVIKRFGLSMNLLFVSPDEPKDVLRAATDKSTIAVVMTENLTQSHVDIVKARTKNMIVQPGRSAMDLYPTLTSLMTQ